MNTPKNSYNFTRRRSKALPLVVHPELGKCILLSKESNHGRWSLFGGGNNISGGKQEKSSCAVKREIKEELGDKVTIDRMKDLGTILSDNSGRLFGKKSKSRVKQRIFAILMNGEIQRDETEIEGVGYYPLEDKYSKVRKGLEQNMDEFAKKALQDYRDKMLHPSIIAGQLKVSISDTKAFDNFLKEIGKQRTIIGKILKW